jgi:cation diffusion facilitator CzcD-associated flavoprotein CzcO
METSQKVAVFAYFLCNAACYKNKIMNQEQARKLIRETFQNDFSKDRFVSFIKEFLNDFDESKKTPQISGQYIRAAFRERIANYERVGQFTDRNGKKIDVLVINLHRQTTLERGRIGLRTFIADYLTNTDRGAEKAAVLAAYVSPDENDWRFSFVTLETELTKTERGTFKEGISSITPARRKSFLVGKYEKTHTAQTRFLKWIEDGQKQVLV